MGDTVGDFIAFLALLVSDFGAAWMAYQDTGRWRRLERYGNVLQAARPDSLERSTLQSVFDQLALSLAPPRKKLRRWAWVVINVGLVIEAVWIVLVAADQRGRISWTVYGVGLAVLIAGMLLRATWHDRRQQWMREEMHRRHEQLTAERAI